MKRRERVVVAGITQEGAQKEDNVLLEGIKLVEQRLARSEQVAFQFAIHLEHERRLRLVVGVISGEEVGEQFAIFVNRIDRRRQGNRSDSTIRRTASRSDAW